MRKVSLIVIFWMFSWQASASFLSGNQLYDWCRSNKPMATFYILGVTDAFKTSPIGQKTVCIREGIIGEQMFDLVCDELKKYPLQRDGDAAAFVEAQIIISFPCHK